MLNEVDDEIEEICRTRCVQNDVGTSEAEFAVSSFAFRGMMNLLPPSSLTVFSGEGNF